MSIVPRHLDFFVIPPIDSFPSLPPYFHHPAENRSPSPRAPAHPQSRGGRLIYSLIVPGGLAQYKGGGEQHIAADAAAAVHFVSLHTGTVANKFNDLSLQKSDQQLVEPGQLDPATAPDRLPGPRSAFPAAPTHHTGDAIVVPDFHIVFATYA